MSLSSLPPVTWIILAILLVVLVAAYAAFQRMIVLQRQVSQLKQARADQQSDMRERTRAIYDLSFAMSSILEYERVLEAALDAGRLGLSMQQRDSESLAALVLVFHTDDNLLHVAAGRKISRGDHSVVLPGKEGIIAEALREAIPILGGRGAKDAELKNFAALDYSRSLLVVPLNAGFDNYGVLIYGSDRQDAFAEDHIEVLTAIGGQVTIALQNALLYRSLIQEKERIVEVEEEARKKLARDLHDGPTQTIAAIAMRMQIIYKQMERDPSQVMPELNKIEQLARQATREARQILFSLRPLVLETQGLSSALKQFATKMGETFGQQVSVAVDKRAEDQLSRHQQGVIFYIVEEAVNNARKHAQAPLIRVIVGYDNGWVIIQVADNGVGFDIEAVSKNYDMRSSLGMINMRERAELLQGTLDLKSSVGSGTTITISIPLNPMNPTGDVSKVKPRSHMTKLAAAAQRVRLNG
jgi:signal transduction histidine kinase